MTVVLRGTVDVTTADTAAAPLLVLGPSLGTTADTWRAATAHLTDRFRVLRFDLPGHGATPAASAPFTVADLADAVLALVDSQGGGRFSYAGASMGGAIGIELALGPAASRLDALAIVCSDARIATPEVWHDRAVQVRRQGTASIVTATAQRWFPPSFLAKEPDVVGRALNDLLDVDDESYARCCEALGAFDRTADTGRIAVPTAVVVGDSDPVVRGEDGRRLAASIPGAIGTVLEDTGHQAQLERPTVIADVIRALAPQSRYDAGLAMRRSVLGSDYVDASLAALTPETADFQRFITETAWGTIWTRPGLERRMRSAVVISSLVSGHHWHELELHLKAGLVTNGLSADELAEILLTTAIYAGVPAANTAFGVLRRVLAEQGKEH